MATRKLNFFEKLAVLTGTLYRHQANQWPRRREIIQGVLKYELAPPRTTDWPAIQADFKKVLTFISSRQYNQLSVKEALVYGAVGLEIVWWFFVGEMIGRRNIPGYLVPADYVSKETRKKAKALEADAAPAH